MSVAVDNTPTYTFETLMTVASEFDAIRLIFAQSNNAGGTATPATIKAAVGVAGDPSDATIAALGSSAFVSAPFAGAATGTLPVAASNVRRAYVMSDWIAMPSTPRTDGGTLPVVVVRAFISAGATLVLQGQGSTDVTGWGSHSSGRIWKVYRKSGDFVSAGQSSFRTSSTFIGTGATPCVGVQYMSRGKILNVFGTGDSITEGAGSSLFGEGFVFPACVAESNVAGNMPVEYSDLGWSSTTWPMILNNTTDALNAGFILPDDLMMIPAWTPNSAPASGGTIVAANIAAQRYYFAQALAAIQAKGVHPIIWNGIPTNTAVTAWGASDSLRIAYAQEIATRAARGEIVIDTNTALSGVVDGTGQMQILAGAVTDGIHPNDAGNAILAALVRQALAQFQIASGVLIT